MQQEQANIKPEEYRQRYLLGRTMIAVLLCELLWVVLNEVAALFIPHASAYNYTAMLVIAPISMVIVPMFYLRWQGFSARTFMGLRGKLEPMDVLVNVLVAAVLIACISVPESLWYDLMDFIYPPDKTEWTYQTEPILAAEILLTCVLPALCEEIFYRGFVFRSLRGAMGFAGAAVLSSLLFTVGHLDYQNIIAPFVIGMTVAYAAEQTGSIYPGIIIHFTYNLIVTFFQVGGLNRLAVEGQDMFQLGGDVVCAVVMFVILRLCLTTYPKRGRYKDSIDIRECAYCHKSKVDIIPLLLILFVYTVYTFAAPIL